jgi:hypothetical protein
MTDEKKIEQLLASFYRGDTTVEEEKLIQQFLNFEDLDEKWHTDRDLFRVINDASYIPLPEGFSEKLEKTIDANIQKTTFKPSYRMVFVRISSVAAVALLCISLFFLTQQPKPTHLADTYADPVEAAHAAEQALLLVSAKLNKGLSSMDKMNESINRTNEIISENLKFNN